VGPLTPLRVLFGYLARRTISNAHIKPFLDDAATYSHQLNVLLPLVAEWSRVLISPIIFAGLSIDFVDSEMISPIAASLRPCSLQPRPQKCLAIALRASSLRAA